MALLQYGLQLGRTSDHISLSVLSFELELDLTLDLLLI